MARCSARRRHKMTNHKKLIIIGGGPAGLSAAVSAYDNGISAEDILVLERDSEAGALSFVEHITDFFKYA